MDAERCSNLVIGAAIEVHRVLRPGLLEAAYRCALVHELRSRGLNVDAEVKKAITYKGVEIVDAFRIDLLVEKCVIVELKAVGQVLPVHRAQLLTYLRASKLKIGLLLNFHEPLLKNGITRIRNTF